MAMPPFMSEISAPRQRRLQLAAVRCCAAACRGGAHTAALRAREIGAPVR